MKQHEIKDFIAALKCAYALRKAGVIKRLHERAVPFEQIAAGANVPASTLRAAIRAGVAAGILIEGEGRSEKGRAVPTYAGDWLFLQAANDLFEGVDFCPSLRQYKILMLLDENRHETFTLKAIAEKVSGNTSIVQRDMGILRRAGLVSGNEISVSGILFCGELGKVFEVF